MNTMNQPIINNGINSSMNSITMNEIQMSQNLISQILKQNYGMKRNNKMKCTPRILFKKEEDERIIQLVKIFGTNNWPVVAQFMNGRSSKQCRDRYSNYLMPGFFQGEWTENEDELLIKLYKEIGPKWSQMKKSFPNRSANNIKNRWYYFLHKKVGINKEKNLQNVKKDDFKIDNANSSKNNFDIPFFQNGECEFLFENEINDPFFNNSVIEVDDY